MSASECCERFAQTAKRAQAGNSLHDWHGRGLVEEAREGRPVDVRSQPMTRLLGDGWTAEAQKNADGFGTGWPLGLSAAIA